MAGARVDIHALHKSYEHGGRIIEVLKGIDLSIAAGEMVAVVGSSGAGKSTFLHVLGTLDAPTAGAVLYDGQDVTRLPASRMADFRNHTIGFVFQFHHLLPEFTALENCAMPGMIAGVSRNEAVDRAAKLLARVGLEHRVTHRPGELSGGEQQRVALARALIMEPKVLLADEPTGNLDTHTGEEILSLIRGLHERLRSTVVIVTHDMKVAESCPRTIKLRDGRIVEDIRR